MSGGPGSRPGDAASTALADGSLLLPDAPSIPGLRFRLYRGAGDHPGMVHVRNEHALASEDTELRSVEGMDNDYARLTNCHPYRDVLVAEVDGTIVAYARVSWEDQNGGGRAYELLGFMDPAWGHRGIGRTMLHHQLRRARAIRAAHADIGESWLGSWAEDGNPGAMALLLSEGFRVVRRFPLMVRPHLDAIDIPPLPDGLEVRPVSRSDWRAIFEAMVEAFRDHFGGVDGSEDGYQRWIGGPEFQPALFQVAWDGDQVAGAILNAINKAENERLGRSSGWLATVFTRRAWRQRGLARALIGRSLVLLREQGMTSAQLGVDQDNPNQALRLYEESGFRVVTSSSAFRRDWD